MRFHEFTGIFCIFYINLGVESDSIYNSSVCNGTREFKNGEMFSLNINKSVDISITREKVWCNNNLTCKEETSETAPHDYIKQLRPIFTVKNTDVRLTHSRGQELGDITVFKTSIDGFVSCDWNNSTVALNISGDGELSVTDHLQNGINYFVFGSFNSTVPNCTSGDRIAIILKRSQCHTNTSTICSGHGDCVTTTIQDSFTCRCCEGYTGQHCETKILPKISSCENITCQHGGTCIGVDFGALNNSDHFNSAHCKCGPFFSGQFCETKMDSCRSNPCQSGVCVERPPSYQCYCVPGFHGKQCEEEYDECISSPCLNGGTCVDRLDKYTCVCKHGHTGVNCETKVDLCYPNPCHFNSSCDNKQDGFTCTCPDGLTGATCDTQINECSSNPCQNQGTCVDLKNGFECICPITFAGIHCEYMMDVFAPPIEGPDGSNHSHNLYVVAGTLSGAIILVLIVLVACYCKMHETYRQLTWRRMRYKKRSLSCPDLESYGGAAATNKHRLSADAIWEATSLCYDNASYDSSQQQSQPIASQRI